ncbi:MAG TPA: aminoglycoside 3'-phosphotransferase [Rhizomicrobium sp.]|jgi:aminoglycoside phosphotransferase|nr:aminoglycoside 3'-phosphotransferase [Rhizomicrobium sp.]
MSDGPSDIAQRVLEAAGLPRGPLDAITTGRSGAQVLRGGGAVLKIAGATERDHTALFDEVAALRWLHGRIRSPAVLWSGIIDGQAALVMEELCGCLVYELPQAQQADGVARIARALAAMHALPVRDCPLDQRMETKIALARANVAAGAVDESDFDDEHAGMTATALFEKMLTVRPADGTLAVTHGDACMPNFILMDDDTVGLIDVGRAGVADPYQDFALFLRSAAYNFPTLDARAILMREYSLPVLDEKRLYFLSPAR